MARGDEREQHFLVHFNLIIFPDIEPAHDSGEIGALPVIVARPAIVAREASSFQIIRM